MPTWQGFFRGKKPCIRFQITGTQGHPEEVVATVDTGFDGFLMISEDQAAPHAMQPAGTTTATLADGQRIGMPMALVNLGFAGRTETGVAMVPRGRCECLVGMDFLRKFKLALLIADQQVQLIDLDEVAVAGPFPRLPTGT